MKQRPYITHYLQANSYITSGSLVEWEARLAKTELSSSVGNAIVPEKYSGYVQCVIHLQKYI